MQFKDLCEAIRSGGITLETAGHQVNASKKDFLESYDRLNPELLAESRTRTVYISRNKKYVIKVAVPDTEGDYANWIEAKDYKTKNEWLGKDRLARCKLVTLNGQGCLIMERVTIPENISNLPSWTDFVDCRQVGYNRKGNLVAYDWA